MSDRIQGLHHITLCTGTAQGDANFFVKVLGMSLVKRTLLYDGVEPVYHLYFANESGDPGTLTICFPWRRIGRKARLLEIDTTDDQLFVLTRWDLGTDPLEVLDALTAAGLAGR